MTQVPSDDSITIPDLINDPYSIYRRLRADAPVMHVHAINRIMLTKAVDAKYVKENPELFCADDPQTPMRRAFLAHERFPNMSLPDPSAVKFSGFGVRGAVVCPVALT